VGCWSFGGGDYWGRQDQEDADQVVRRAVELGINYFDTAEAYNDGRSESSLGRAIRGIPRDTIVIGTKISPGNTTPEALVRHCEASLERLGLEYVDLYMVHWPITAHSIGHFTEEAAPVPSVAEAFETLRKLQQQGKIRHIGVSNFAAPKLTEAMDTGTEIAVNQLPYSLVARAIEFEILPLCVEVGVGVVGYMPLWQGLLSDRYERLDDLPAMRRRTRQFDARKNELSRHGEQGAERQTWEAVLAVRKLARELGSSTSDLALRWALTAPGMSCVLAGARNRAQLEANASAAAARLPREAVQKLSAATDGLKAKLGPSCDYFESTANDRTR
jgi:aryl-alcohol dehydrogenase-like predicted oxidoreductase